MPEIQTTTQAETIQNFPVQETMAPFEKAYETQPFLIEKSPDGAPASTETQNEAENILDVFLIDHRSALVAEYGGTEDDWTKHFSTSDNMAHLDSDGKYYFSTDPEKQFALPPQISAGRTESVADGETQWVFVYEQANSNSLVLHMYSKAKPKEGEREVEIEDEKNFAVLPRQREINILNLDGYIEQVNFFSELFASAPLQEHEAAYAGKGAGTEVAKENAAADNLEDLEQPQSESLETEFLSSGHEEKQNIHMEPPPQKNFLNLSSDAFRFNPASAREAIIESDDEDAKFNLDDIIEPKDLALQNAVLDLDKNNRIFDPEKIDKAKPKTSGLSAKTVFKAPITDQKSSFVLESLFPSSSPKAITTETPAQSLSNLSAQRQPYVDSKVRQPISLPVIAKPGETVQKEPQKRYYIEQVPVYGVRENNNDSVDSFASGQRAAKSPMRKQTDNPAAKIISKIPVTKTASTLAPENPAKPEPTAPPFTPQTPSVPKENIQPVIKFISLAKKSNPAVKQVLFKSPFFSAGAKKDPHLSSSPAPVPAASDPAAALGKAKQQAPEKLFGARGSELDTYPSRQPNQPPAPTLPVFNHIPHQKKLFIAFSKTDREQFKIQPVIPNLQMPPSYRQNPGKQGGQPQNKTERSDFSYQRVSSILSRLQNSRPAPAKTKVQKISVQPLTAFVAASGDKDQKPFAAAREQIKAAVEEPAQPKNQNIAPKQKSSELTMRATGQNPGNAADDSTIKEQDSIPNAQNIATAA